MEIKNEEWHVFTKVLSQSFFGTFPCGLCYGWGAISEAINYRFNPNNPFVFVNNHGTFGAVILLVLGALPMPLLQHIIVTKQLFTEFQIQIFGVFVTSIGLYLTGIGLRFKLLWLYYLSISIAGIGGLCIYRRVVFSHQLWFKHINRQNLGSGLIGFGIGLWTVVFFAISTHILSVLSIDEVLFVYSSICLPFSLYPTLTIVELKPTNYDKKDVETINNIESDIDGNIEMKNSQRYLPIDSEAKIDNHVGIDIESVIDSSIQNQKDNQTNYKKDCLVVIMTNKSEVDKTEEKKDDKIDDMIDDKIVNFKDLLHRATSLGIVCDPTTGATDLEFNEIIRIPETWIITIFFAAVLTPGWGIKLGSYAMLRDLFAMSLTQSSIITSVYVTLYAFGRLLSGLLADRIGLFSTFYLIIITMFIALIIVPQTADSIAHAGPTSKGAYVFVGLLWLIGLLYGGSIALFYSVVFEIFGARNYNFLLFRSVFSVSICGFAMSVIIGGISGAYSFSHSTNTKALASRWFYSMAGGLMIALVFLYILKPIQYDRLLQYKVNKSIRLNKTKPKLVNNYSIRF